MNHNRDTGRALVAKIQDRQWRRRDLQLDSLVLGLNAAGARLFTDRAGASVAARRYIDSKLQAIARADCRIQLNNGFSYRA